MAKQYYFDTSVAEKQDGFTVQMIDDLIDYVNANSPSGRAVNLFDTLPEFEMSFVINAFHPMASDILEIHFFQDELGNWWPFMTVDVLCLVSKLTAYGYCLMDTKG